MPKPESNREAAKWCKEARQLLNYQLLGDSERGKFDRACAAIDAHLKAGTKGTIAGLEKLVAFKELQMQYRESSRQAKAIQEANVDAEEKKAQMRLVARDLEKLAETLEALVKSEQSKAKARSLFLDLNGKALKNCITLAELSFESESYADPLHQLIVEADELWNQGQEALGYERLQTAPALFATQSKLLKASRTGGLKGKAETMLEFRKFHADAVRDEAILSRLNLPGESYSEPLQKLITRANELAATEEMVALVTARELMKTQAPALFKTQSNLIKVNRALEAELIKVNRALEAEALKEYRKLQSIVNENDFTLLQLSRSGESFHEPLRLLLMKADELANQGLPGLAAASAILKTEAPAVFETQSRLLKESRAGTRKAEARRQFESEVDNTRTAILDLEQRPGTVAARAKLKQLLDAGLMAAAGDDFEMAYGKFAGRVKAVDAGREAAIDFLQKGGKSKSVAVELHETQMSLREYKNLAGASDAASVREQSKALADAINDLDVSNSQSVLDRVRSDIGKINKKLADLSGDLKRSPQALAAMAVSYQDMRTRFDPAFEIALAQDRIASGPLAGKIAQIDSSAASKDWTAAHAFVSEAFRLAMEINILCREGFLNAYATASSLTLTAVNLTEIGGGAVGTSLAASKSLADRGLWQAAHAQLAATVADADKVNARAPFVLARRLHEATIKASFSIAHEGLGEGVKRDWARALDTFKSNNFEAAARMVNELAQRIDKAKNSAEFIVKRTAVVTDRSENQAAMKAAVEASVVDVAALRVLVIKEIGSGGLAAQANAVGEDPGANSRKPIGSASSAEALFLLYDWFALKDKKNRKEGDVEKITTDQLWDCWRYRQKYVTQLIDDLRRKFPTLIAKTSGSTDLESDIDITFASSDPGDDVKAAIEFNTVVIAKFGKPSGRVFDVNIYPRDYNAIEESINPDYNLTPIIDRPIDQPTKAMQQLSSLDQDVATLLKQRRFLDAEEFAALMESVIAGAPDPTTKVQIRKQFEEGEDIYLLTALEKVDSIKATLSRYSMPLPKLMAQFDKLRESTGLPLVEQLEQVQILLPQVLDELEAEFPSEVMETTDAMYLEKMAVLRQNQTEIAQLDNPAAKHAEQHGGECAEAHPREDHETWRAAKSDWLKAEVKKAQFTNIIFANEAYMSEGAIAHVVAGIQAKDETKKAEVLGKLTPATLMQSCNEQLADFFKDMKALGNVIERETDVDKKRCKTGEAFVHASKYLVRLLDAAQILADKFAGLVPAVALQFSLFGVTEVKSALELQSKVEAVLLALRKSSEVPAGAKGEVGFDEAYLLFKVRTIGDFRKLITEFGAELNQQVRRNKAFQTELAVDPQMERQYFGVPAMPADLKVLLDDVAATLNASFGEDAVQATLGEAQGEVKTTEKLLLESVGAKPLPDLLAGPLQQAAIRAEQILTAFAKIDAGGVLARGTSLGQQLQAKIIAITEFSPAGLHDAYVGDIKRAVEGLREKVAATERLVTEIRNSLEVVIPKLGEQLAALKERLA